MPDGIDFFWLFIHPWEEKMSHHFFSSPVKIMQREGLVKELHGIIQWVECRAARNPEEVPDSRMRMGAPKPVEGAAIRPPHQRHHHLV